MAAAVADFRPGQAVDEKISKSGRDGLALALEPTEDVLAALAAARAPGQTLVGFAAEHGECGGRGGRGKLERKGLDAVVVNDISRAEIGFDAADNEVTIVTAAASATCRWGPRRRSLPRSSMPWKACVRRRVPWKASDEHGRGMAELFKKGSELLEAGDFMAAISLERALAGTRQELDPRGASARLLPPCTRFEQAAEEFAAVVERHLVNDYAHFCLGRALANTGRTQAARRHAALAANMRPDARTTRRSAGVCGPPEPARRQGALHDQAQQAVHAARVEAGGRDVGVDPEVRAGAAEAHEPRLAVPPEQHPGVEVAGRVQRHRLGAQQALGQAQPHVERLAVEPRRAP